MFMGGLLMVTLAKVPAEGGVRGRADGRRDDGIVFPEDC